MPGWCSLSCACDQQPLLMSVCLSSTTCNTSTPLYFSATDRNFRLRKYFEAGGTAARLPRYAVVVVATETSVARELALLAHSIVLSLLLDILRHAASPNVVRQVWRLHLGLRAPGAAMQKCTKFGTLSCCRSVHSSALLQIAIIRVTFAVVDS